MKAQNAYCDSLMVYSVNIDINMLNLTVYNSSQHFIAYPFFTINLDSNSYIQLNDSVNVLSFLSVVGDANNGYSTAGYYGNILAANLVPLNTVFTGTIRITDPNDSTFNCIYPFMFVYGTMPTSLASNKYENIKLYPSPANDFLNVTIDKYDTNTKYTIINQVGNIVTDGKINAVSNAIDLSGIESGVYYLQVKSNQLYTIKIIILKQ
jgi:hypothetical protein